MKGKIELLPGKPDEGNREYLPEAIRNSNLLTISDRIKGKRRQYESVCF